MGKLQAGAFGTLSVLTEISVKVLPRPETSCSLVVRGLDDAAAIAVLATALNAPDEVSAAGPLAGHRGGAFGDPGRVERRGRDGVCASKVRAPSVDFRAKTLQGLLGPASRLNDRDSTALWAEIAAVGRLMGAERLDFAERLVWRLCPTPSAAPALLARIRSGSRLCRGLL